MKKSRRFKFSKEYYYRKRVIKDLNNNIEYVVMMISMFLYALCDDLNLLQAKSTALCLFLLSGLWVLFSSVVCIIFSLLNRREAKHYEECNNNAKD